MDLFSYANEQAAQKAAPLAARMRPRTLDDFIGQEEVIGKGKFLRRMIEADNVPSIILFGPPGTGKTTLANIIANLTGSQFEKINAVSSGVAEIRKIVEAAKERLLLYKKRTILFIDEIHRFNKSQQDALLPYVEDGRVTLIGATTENPYFEVNSPLLSRMRIIRLQALTKEGLAKILKTTLTDAERGLGARALGHDQESLALIAEIAAGDARVALNILEQASAMVDSGGKLTVEAVNQVVGEKLQRYDKKGDNHYDVVSAFIKSMRGSDPDAALHYLARMLAAGEDVKFIARRIVICASEDVGNAEPQALVLAMAAAQAVQFIGMPEASITLGQAVTYIASAPKSNKSCEAIGEALTDVKNKDYGSVPAHLRDAHYKGAGNLGHGVDYLYPHNYPGSFVKQQYLPDKLIGTVYYQPTTNGKEAKIAERLAEIRGSDV